MDFDTACTLAKRIMREEQLGGWELLRLERPDRDRWLVVVRHTPTNETIWLHTIAHWQAVSKRD